MLVAIVDASSLVLHASARCRPHRTADPQRTLSGSTSTARHGSTFTMSGRLSSSASRAPCASRGAASLEEQLRAVLPFSRPSGAGAGPRTRRLREPWRPQRDGDLACAVHGCLTAASLDHDVDHRHRRRVAHGLAEGQLLGIEGRVVLIARVTDAVVVGIERLHDRLARHLAASGTAGNLRQQLKRPLGRTEIGEAEPDVRVMTPTSVTRGKSCPFAIICVPTSTSSSPAANCRQQRRNRPAAANRVAIDARDARGRKQRRGPRPRRAPSRTRAAREKAPHTCGRSSASASSSCSSGSAPGAMRLCTVSDTLQLGHSSVSPHSRQKTAVAKPRLLSSTIDCSPRSSAPRERVAQASRSGRRPGPRPRTPRACPRCGRRASGRSSTRRSSVTRP